MENSKVVLEVKVMYSFISKYIKLVFSYFRWSGYRIIAIFISDKNYIKWKYKKRVKRSLDINNPQAFTDKLQWLKLNWHQDLITQCADKYEVRKIVADRIGLHILKDLYGVYDKAEDIDLESLPDSFVLKVNHVCKQMILCRNKAELDWQYSIRLLNHYLNNNNYFYAREWSYKNIVPRIICEEYLTKDGNTLFEYNFYCYDGVPRFVEIIDRYSQEASRVNMYDIDLNLLDRKYKSRPINIVIERTAHYEKMIEYARKLSQGFPFVRVDLFFTNNRIYFGEMTFYPLSGIYRFEPQSFDLLLGSFLLLPKVD